MMIIVRGCGVLISEILMMLEKENITTNSGRTHSPDTQGVQALSGRLGAGVRYRPELHWRS